MLDLFDSGKRENILPYGGEVSYDPTWLDRGEADSLFAVLLGEEAWQSDIIKMFGKTIVTDRKVIWYGEPGCSYTYSGIKKEPRPWSALMRNLKERVEPHLGMEFNSCLANLYHHGEEGMGWHSDDEPELGEEPEIAVISLGAERKFKFKHKTSNEVVDQVLGAGSLLVMQGKAQQQWWHSLPKSKRVTEPRISLTFRKIV